LISGSGNHNISINTGSIQSFENQGTITNTNTGKFNFNITKGTITNFSNSGTIKGGKGINIGNQSTLTNFSNSGVIKVNGTGFNNQGIYLQGATIENLNNEGTIDGGGNGIIIHSLNNQTTKIGTLKNTGTIQSNINAINFEATTGSIEIDTILVESGLLKGGHAGIRLNPSKATIQKIDIKAGAKVEGTNFGIHILQGKAFTGDIEVAGTLKGGVAAIGNTGTIGENGKGNIIIKSTAKLEAKQAAIYNFGGKLQGSITIEKGADLGSTTSIFNQNRNNRPSSLSGSIINHSNNNLTIKNQNSTIGGSITSSGAGSLNIANSGNAEIGADIKNEGSGSLNITNSGSGSIGGSISASGNAPISIKNEGNANIGG
ncbi:MAG: hypothetical protein K2O80_01670, partial [Helicobacter apodemus]|nr:hypothetical protein [Helicobacter apodemus]